MLALGIAYCFAAIGISIGVGAAVGSLFAGAWRIVTTFAVAGVLFVTLGELADRRRRKRWAMDAEAILDSYIMQFEQYRLETERLIDNVQNILGDDIRQRVVTLARNAGRLEGAIGAFHGITGADLDPKVLWVMIDVIGRRVNEALEASMPFMAQDAEEESE